MTTALDLIRDVATHLGELKLSQASADGTATTIIDASLLKHFPVDVRNFNAWIYGMTGSNLGSEQRAASWSASSNTMTLYTPGFDAETRKDDRFEIHLRTQRTTKLDAINDAIGLAGLYWEREVVDESITTAQNTWEYTLSFQASLPLNVYKIEIQSITTGSLVGYPYTSAEDLDWSILRTMDDTGAETYKLRFGRLPAPGRKVRVYALLGLGNLSADSDVLPVGGRFGEALRQWIIHWASNHVIERESFTNPGSNAGRYEQKSAALQKDLDRILLQAPPKKPSRIIVPGRGTTELAGPPGRIFLGTLWM